MATDIAAVTDDYVLNEVSGSGVEHSNGGFDCTHMLVFCYAGSAGVKGVGIRGQLRMLGWQAHSPLGKILKGSDIICL